MDTNSPAVTRLRAARHALTVLRLALAAANLAAGYVLLFAPRVVDDLPGGGIAHEPRLMLSVFHLAGAFGLLVPTLAEPTSVLLGLMMGAVAAHWFAAGQASLTAAAALASFTLFTFGAGTRHRRRAAADAWGALLLRFEEEDTPQRVPINPFHKEPRP